MVKNLRRKGKFGSKAIVVENETVYIVLQDGSKRVVLPTALWASALRESHDSVYSCHLRTPQTYARIAATYWWPDMNDHVRRWVQACRDCGSRKAKAREVIPPLRSQGVGDPGDRWALDVAGPLPLTSGGNRYVIAAVDYATRYSVVAAVTNHTAKDVANFIAEELVFVFGPMRELAMDGAPELNGKVIDALVEVLQAKQLTPVPYRPALLGLVERFHRTWKDMVSLYVLAAQDDWDRWLTCASYAYNGAKHSGTGFSPNELMMGRKLRAPNELLRQSGVTHVGDFAEYHRALVTGMARATRAARAALAKDQLRIGDSVWVLKPPKGKGITKLDHQWVGPAKITQDAGFDNFEVIRDDTGEHLVVHCSFLVTSACPSDSLGSVADTVLRELAEERGVDEDTEGDAGDDNEGSEALQRYEQRSAGPGANAGTGVARAPDQNAATSTNSESTHRASGGKDGGSEAARAPAARMTSDRVGSDGRSVRRDAERGGVTATGAVRTSDDGSGGVPGAQQRPRIATGRRQEGTRATGDAAARPQLAVRDQGRKRKARAGVAVEEEAARQQRLAKRRQGDAAREERAARRQAHRNEQVSTVAQAAGADADNGVHGGDDARQEERDDEGRGASTRSDDGPGVGQAGAGSSEVGGAEVEMLRGRGRPRRPEPMPTLLQVATAGHIIERARRRVRNRAGRYVLEHEVEYAEQQGQPTARRWLSHEEFEELDDAGKIEGDLGARDGGSSVACHVADGRWQPRTRVVIDLTNE
ncbi:hypothetical protein PF004_g28099 [Phytophthora fragariae]|uniref:Integrase catalytic domain-containing protein n=1 Tax=Phytophthora fragariae TaxID=53985 RepID=A0A6G0MIM1_9STRA|nr:hypothetical protein PF004_g28099 [Phytophthora fragariae]